MSVRVRFAPSPTGLLHVGALRDALFKYLFARKHGGQNLLRIEDTDRTRYHPESEQEFIDTLSWVGIDFDEGPHLGGPHAPYRQSERKEAGIYAEYIQILLDKGHAYRAYETSEELTEMREYQQINKLPTGYFGGKWRDATEDELKAVEGQPFVIRQRIPRDTTIVIHDLIRGRIEWDSNTIDDPVLIKADGMPTYHFASMVDDHLMEITHILRGEEWISSAPKHACLFDAFGWERPIFVHCPVIVGKDGKKLSKRHGATRVLDYAAEGYLPDPLKNFIALIGWSPGDDREIFEMHDLVQAFKLEGLQPSPGRFDLDKLRWLSGHAIRQMPTDSLLDAVLAFIEHPYTVSYWAKQAELPVEERLPGSPDPVVLWASLTRLAAEASRDRAYALEALKLEQERVQTLADFGPACLFFFDDELAMDEKAVAKWFKEPHAAALFGFLIAECDTSFAAVSGLEELQTVCEQALKGFQEAHGIEKLGPLVHPTRVALTGRTFGPGLFELMAVLGPVRMKTRLRRALTLVNP